MSIATAIQNAQQRVANAYTAISNKGGTLPATQNLANMPTAIASIPSGGSATIDSLTITPTTSQQTITASGGVDGYSPITVNAVTSSIDNNITAGNIKSGVSILGVSGSLTELKGETRSVSLTNKNGQTFTPSSGKNGITSITVSPTNQAKTITPTTSQQTISVPSGYSGFGNLTVNAVTSSIDANITAGNIKKNVQILGVTGSYEGGGGGYTEIPSYQVSSGVLSKRVGSLNGSEFSNITSVDDYGLYNYFFHCTLTGTIDLSSITSVGLYGLNFAFRSCGGLTGSLNLSSLLSVNNYGFQYAFAGCTGFTGLLNLSSLTSIGNYGFYYAFQNCTGLTGVDLSSLTTLSGNYSLAYALQGCTNITSVDLSSLTTTSGTFCLQEVLSGCSKLTSVDLSALTTLSGKQDFYYSFRGCVKLETVSFPALTTMSGTDVFYACFYNCTGLTTVYFQNLESVNNREFYYAFQYCSKLSDIYFNSLTTTSFGSKTNQFNSMFNSNTASTSGTCTVHFPSNLQSTVSGLTGYPTFGGNASRIVIAFDLPSTANTINVSISKTGTGSSRGSVAVNGTTQTLPVTVSVDEGDTVSLTATGNGTTGMTIYKDGVSVATGVSGILNYSFSPTADTTISVKFEYEK